MLAYGRGRQAAQKKEFSFLSFYHHRFFLVGYTTTTKKLVKSDVASAAQAVAVTSSSSFATHRHFSFLFFLFLQTRALHCITTRRGRNPYPFSLFCTEDEGGGQERKVAAVTAPIYT